ncbi:hypothetical protein [Novosphingobium arvoryzae]|nr:hypothetical protein [Novosphingobium arvoryzae]
MAALTLATFSNPILAHAQNADSKPTTPAGTESACAIHIENDFDIKRRLDEIGCTAGDSLLIYNYSSLAKWEVVLPVRVAAAMVCDMNKTITDIGSVGMKPYQSVICTYSGKVRRFKSNDENLKGWGQVF